MATHPSPSPPPYLITFDEFNPVYTSIHLPKNVLLVRGYDTRYDPVSDYAAYYTHDTRVARGYAAYDHHALGLFRTTRPIKLYDLRYIKVLLREYIQQLRGMHVKSIIDAMRVCTLSLGLYSYDTQLKLFDERYPAAPTPAADTFHAVRESLYQYKRRPPPYANPIELTGVRIGETYNDREMLQFLKELFGKEIDGYIAPKFRSPFHVEKDGMMNAELVVFNPRESGIELLSSGSANAPDGVNYRRHNINYFLDNTGMYTMKTFKTCTLYTAPSRRGSGGAAVSAATRQMIAIYNPNSLLDKGDADPENRRVIRRAKRMAAAWRKALPPAYFTPIPRVPTMRPVPWSCDDADIRTTPDGRPMDLGGAGDY